MITATFSDSYEVRDCLIEVIVNLNKLNQFPRAIEVLMVVEPKFNRFEARRVVEAIVLLRNVRPSPVDGFSRVFPA